MSALRVRVLAALADPVDAAALYALRVTWGAAIAGWVVWLFLSGYVYEHWIGLSVRFPFIEALPVLPDTALLILFDALFLLAVCTALGVFARAAAAAGAAVLTYLFLLEKCLYQNHLYLLCMLGFLLALTPAHEGASLERMLRKKPQAQTAPAWSLWLLRAQLAIVYVGAGVAKLNADWLARQPVSIWLADRADWPVLGPLLGAPLAPYAVAWGGMLFDLSIVPALLWRRTRVVAAVVVVAFHLTNAALFDIDVFPWLMIPATLFAFFPPDFPRRLLRVRAPAPATAATTTSIPLLVLLALHLAVQVLLPLRHFVLNPVDPMWSEEGHRFAWRMMLRWKETEARFYAVEPARGLTWEIDASAFVRSFQYDELVNHPDVLRSMCVWLARHYERERGTAIVEIHVVDDVVMNGHPARLLVDPAVDLGHTPPTALLSPSPWILPREDEGRQAAARVAASHLADAVEATWRKAAGVKAP